MRSRSRRCCFVEDRKEMYKTVKRTCRVLFWLINPIVLWRFRCRCRRRCLSSLLLFSLVVISLHLLCGFWLQTRCTEEYDYLL